jgi:YidC/Oxa1 family membrane protein insertase
MFTTLIVQPIFNLLVLIYALLPGHNFGLAIILFTIVIRMIMWPLVKKQLRNARVMRAIQPELKRIKQETKGDRQRESAMVMELYKERGINPFSSIGILIVQLPILIGLYVGLQRIIKDPNAIVTFAYPALQQLSWMKQLATDISQLDMTLLGFIDLSRPALGDGGIYWPAMFLVIGSAVTQYYQTKQLMPDDKDARKLRHILRDAGKGEQADSSEVNAAVGRSTRYFIPVLIFFFTVNLASALALYWLVSGLVAMLQQRYILNQDEEEIETKLHKDDDKRPKKKVTSTARVVSIRTEPSSTKTTKKSSSKKAKKRRK